MSLSTRRHLARLFSSSPSGVQKVSDAIATSTSLSFQPPRPPSKSPLRYGLRVCTALSLSLAATAPYIDHFVDTHSVFEVCYTFTEHFPPLTGAYSHFKLSLRGYTLCTSPSDPPVFSLALDIRLALCCITCNRYAPMSLPD